MQTWPFTLQTTCKVADGFPPACFTCMQRSMTIVNISQVRFEGSLCRMQHCDLLCREEDAVNAAKEAFSRFHLVCLH